MASRRGVRDDPEIRSLEEDEHRRRPQQDDPTQIAVVYRRRVAKEHQSSVEVASHIEQTNREPRVSFALPKRTSWNRSLSTRGRTSICVAAGLDFIPLPKQREAKKKSKQGLYKKKSRQQDPPDFGKEQAYFQEVDAFELLEESPSPKHFSTWAMGTQQNVLVRDLPSILERWKISKLACGSQPSSGGLFRIKEIGSVSGSSVEQTPHRTFQSKFSQRINASQGSVVSNPVDGNSVGTLTEDFILRSLDSLRINEECYRHPEANDSVDGCKERVTDVKEDSLVPSSLSLAGECRSAFTQLLIICRQSEPLTLSEVFSQFCNPSNIVKIGEGTYGEAFKAGGNICKIVPVDGDSLVNGEVQKRSEEILEEVLLSLSLNTLRGQGDNMCQQNACSNFIEAKDFRVCQGAYSEALVSAWEDWDTKHGSENDNPKEFSEKQSFIVFILSDGGKDLESFVLLNFDEAQSLLVQVTSALAVAEVAFEFEHRDLHWGNILLSRKEAPVIDFTIQGRKMQARTFGVIISIIDFTLSRINTGEAILFLDLSSDPGIFEGPKGDVQFETYRKMREETEECWEGSFPKTNVLWLQYLVDILLLKKSFTRTAKEAGHLRSFKKRLNSYDSAKDALSDCFFSDLLVEKCM